MNKELSGLYHHLLSAISDEMLTRDYTAAKTRLLVALDYFPHDPEIQFKLALVHIKNEDWTAAVNCLGQISVTNLTEETMTLFDLISYYLEYLSIFLESGSAPKTDKYQMANQLIIEHYSSLPYREIQEDIKEPLSFIISFPVKDFPYIELINAYVSAQVIIEYDDQRQLHYALHNGKKLYYYFDNIEHMKNAYRYSCCMEQHKNSPHCYLTETFCVNEEDTILDIGAGEGNFLLDSVELCQKAWLFEPNPIWRRSLEATFAPWIDKVNIVPKLVADVADANTVTIDELMAGETVDFIKIDVEGCELKVLQGAKNTLLENKNLKIAVCTYHHAEDATILSKFLTDLGFIVEFSRGYMLPGGINYPPYFRKGLIRAVR